jgi:hypothetical protein
MDSGSRDETIQKITAYLLSHRILTMATATKDGDPDATALEYASNEMVVYVSCKSDSRKVCNVAENPRVFYEVHDDTEITKDKVKQVKAVQVAASARILRPGESAFDAAFAIMVKKFPVFSAMHKDTRVILQFTPRNAWYLDYEKKFFHRDEVSFK